MIRSTIVYLLTAARGTPPAKSLCTIKSNIDAIKLDLQRATEEQLYIVNEYTVDTLVAVDDCSMLNRQAEDDCEAIIKLAEQQRRDKQKTAVNDLNRRSESNRTARINANEVLDEINVLSKSLG